MVNDRFDYDAYGNSIKEFTATDAPSTDLLYSGEQYDLELGDSYLRARYYDSKNGRFNRLDDYAGSYGDPQSLHKYAYCHGDPVNGIDPSGLFTLIELLVVVIIGLTLVISLSGCSSKQTGLIWVDDIGKKARDELLKTERGKRLISEINSLAEVTGDRFEVKKGESNAFNRRTKEVKLSGKLIIFSVELPYPNKDLKQKAKVATSLPVETIYHELSHAKHNLLGGNATAWPKGSDNWGFDSTGEIYAVRETNKLQKDLKRPARVRYWGPTAAVLYILGKENIDDYYDIENVDDDLDYSEVNRLGLLKKW